MEWGAVPRNTGRGACLFAKSFDSVFGRETKEHSMFEGLFQPMHLLVIFGIALLVFGPKKLPELGKGIGEGIRGFKSAMKAEDEKPASATTTITSDQPITKG
jgi:sec-independent protein translocase protein TatA